MLLKYLISNKFNSILIYKKIILPYIEHHVFEDL